GSLGGLEIAKGARVLASAAAIGEVEPERWAPVIWTGFHGLGRTAVFALDAHTDESASGDLIAALAVRATGFASRARILVPLPAEIPVAALELGRSDSGSWQGWETRSGYYRGRQIAPVMSFLGADWLLRPERATTEEPERVLDWLEIRPGSSVADFGAGNGYFTLRLAKRVGATGRVYAVDIQQEMLDLLAGRARASGHENIELVLSSEKDPRLPPDGVDLILAVDVYHELSHPAETLEALRRALKKDGRLVLVEYRGEDPSVPIRPLHRMTRAQAEAELRPFGFRLAANGEFLRHQHILVFEKSADAKDDAAEGESSDAREEPAPSDKATNPPLEGSTPDPARESEPSDSDDLGESGKPNDSGGDRPSR
ncbi:MAG TPA: class I SAM-dependent methyltransferase, partial [Planctomycetota bacterium]|nr:class I SAM-dependent methyltransferase [Planctomycetota bacterium]